MAYANQRKIRVAQRAKRSRDNLYATFNLDALQQAMSDLNGSSGLLLWLYLNKNQEGYALDLSQKACESWGLKRDSYYRAFRELVSKGYLKIGDNGYEFFERSENHTEPTENQSDSMHSQQGNNTQSTQYNTHDEYDIIPEFDGKVAYIIDGGESRIGLESTVCKVIDGIPTILRPG